jgi:hypothetical protein
MRHVGSCCVCCVVWRLAAFLDAVIFSAPEWDLSRAYDLALCLQYVEAHLLPAR